MRGTAGANTTTPPTVNEVRDGILDDATRFSGGNIDDTISSRGTADAGDAMNLAADAIKAVSYDESTAFPIPAALTVDNGAVDAKITYIMDTILSETPGQLSAAFIKLFDVATPALTSESINQTADNNTLLTAIAGYLDTEIAALITAVITNATGADVATDVVALKAIADAILAMLDNARGEPGQGQPPVNLDLATKIDHLYKAWRNPKDNDGSTTQLYDDSGSTVDTKQTTSESAGTVTKAKWVSGP